LRSRKSLCHSRISQHFIEHENSLPCSQGPAIGLYTERHESSPHQSILIHFNIILSPMSKFPWCSVSFWLFHQNRLFSSMRVARSTHPIHPRLGHSNYTWQRVQVMKLVIKQFSPASYHFIPLRSKYSPQHPVLKHPHSVFLL
jgi:hypothetical protein